LQFGDSWREISMSQMSELADVLFGVFPFVDPLPRVPGKSREKIESSYVPAILRLLEFLQRSLIQLN